jgi:hypothetical protein
LQTARSVAHRPVGGYHGPALYETPEPRSRSASVDKFIVQQASCLGGAQRLQKGGDEGDLEVGAALLAARLDLGFQAATSTLLAAGAIVVACVVTWGLFHVMRITVKVTNKAIVWGIGDVYTSYRFAAIGHCEIGERRSEASGSEGGQTVFAVVLKNGAREVFGVPPTISAEVLRSVLEERGVIVLGFLEPPTFPTLDIPDSRGS